MCKRTLEKSMSLDSYSRNFIASFFEIADYKHLPKVLLALDELKRPSSHSDIENCFVDHRQRVVYASLRKTIRKGIQLKLIKKNEKYELTELGRQWADIFRRAIDAIEKLEAT